MHVGYDICNKQSVFEKQTFVQLSSITAVKSGNQKTLVSSLRIVVTNQCSVKIHYFGT